jgi:hypothetical protein
MVSLLEVNNIDVVTDNKQSNTIHTFSGGPVTELSSTNTAHPHLPQQKPYFLIRKYEETWEF